MSSRNSFFARFAVSAALMSSLFIGSHAFVPTVYGCGSVNSTDCRTSSSARSDTSYSSFYGGLQILIDAAGVLIP